ncbi:TetR/AcrR family transcriptional regulator [Frankia sp. Cr2]|uniref:TetR/AcrR family transcriptional regulator n=1 Tax=Frankia sp. Cr2 TaxID=3073932 RepID=UPI002AD58269|nr:TetR/AcrR family transcriptional regulator [Frankia sp. Cr2]
MGRPKQFDPDAAVDRAMDVFWRKGYAGTTPQDLVDELGIGKGSLYATFDSKRALFDRALERYREQQADTLARIIDQPGPVKPRLRAALQFIVEANAADPDRRGCLAVNTAAELGGADPKATLDVRHMFERTQGALEAVITEGQRTGEIRSDIPGAALSAYLFTTVVGLQLLVKTVRDPLDLTQVVEAAIRSL